MLYHEFLHLTHNYTELIQFSAEKKVIRDKFKCPRCDAVIHLNIQQQSLLIHCSGHYYKKSHGKKRMRKACNFKISALSGTWFSRATLDLPKICRLICYFMLLNSPRQLFLKAELNTASNTIVDWLHFCRELTAQWLINNQEQIGGPNKIIEIDEAKFGKRKYHRGRLLTGQWLFGVIERDTGRLFVLPVENRSAETLIPIIRRYILPGTTIYSDSWRAYSQLKNYNFTHYLINHSENFVNPQTGVHTQNIERL